MNYDFDLKVVWAKEQEEKKKRRFLVESCII